MTEAKRSVPNRPLDLRELDEPFFAHILKRLDELIGREAISYLHPSKRWEYPWALERARLSPGSSILDAGCGASIFPVYLAELGHQVTGVDLSVPARLGNLHGVHIDYVNAGLTNLPFADESFDAVFCISVIEHLGYGGIPQALAELRRVTQPGGRLMITTDYFKDANAEIWYEGEGEPFRVDWNFFDEEHLRHYLLQAPGLTLEGELDLQVDWNTVQPQMRRFHGYPYTSVGITLIRT
ncbi:class I SAM-dependent methyltransferase [Nitrosococcus wardiae]|uniref:Class I SAM-dependent methyltransferase n=1 Tax=Nitrosococcus wardiae TaxID=1814290 RepID=A0A4P7C4F2_9GAMM|nr:class I SAM-dependent methyltransferase [Nitrosococcus wardiae]QBQ55732.1 class I SAM-dependent methyltransferase [Nitrosococcus wardiae]